MVRPLTAQFSKERTCDFKPNMIANSLMQTFTTKGPLAQSRGSTAARSRKPVAEHGHVSKLLTRVSDTSRCMIQRAAASCAYNRQRLLSATGPGQSYPLSASMVACCRNTAAMKAFMPTTIGKLENCIQFY